MLRPLILASGSPYRRALLKQLQLPFEADSPHIDEEALPGETAQDLAQRLAAEKARALRAAHPQALIIGSDQVAECDGHILGKPGGRDRAVEQLRLCRGRAVHFHTGLSLLDAGSGEQRTELETFTVHFRRLTGEQINRYVEREKPFDCAGSFKVEGLGIVLFEKMEGSDMNSLIGLPLIRLVTMLGAFGVDPLA
ncbi:MULTISPECIES: nucleoside triphosphate pyrophosphatase [unclassified Microbulbifer]|uniref:Maf family protein n=1 Tax=unclassified Microbulbifer TaxID=2619833 RepID=UPI0027E54442|nr:MULTISPECIES: nucleoside triphosphate pyrophosphatase [unclassified Microbulbifer]